MIMEIGGWGRMEKNVTENVATNELTGQDVSWIVCIDKDIIQDDGKSWDRVGSLEASCQILWYKGEYPAC